MPKGMIPFDPNAKLPAHLSGKDEILESLSSGLDSMGGFPVLSIRGSKWRLKMQGEENPLLTKDRNPLPAISFVIVGANDRLAKTYYNKIYQEGDDASPDCWSMDGIEPDVGVEKPQSKDCKRCPMNRWGSKITPQGTKTRACSDTKRLAVVMAMDLASDDMRIGPTLLRVPPASLAKGSGSLRSLMQTVEKMNAKLAGVIVRAGFDIESDYPKLNFEVAGFLDESMYERAVELSQSEVTQRIIGGMDEVLGNEPKDEDDVAAETAAPEPEATPEVDTSVAIIGEEEVEEEEEEKEPPKPRKRRTRKKATTKKAAAKKAKPAPVAEEEEEEESSEDEDDFLGAIDDIKSMFN